MSLSDLLALPLGTARDHTGQLAASLEFMHHRGLIHGDVKPSNILVQGTRTKLCDFWSCFDTFESRFASESIAATLHYRAPEVALNNRLHYGSDIWSLGCIASEMLTGEMMRILRDHWGDR